MATKLKGPETAEEMYKAIAETAIRTGHTEFTKFGTAIGIIIIPFFEGGDAGLHSIGEVDWLSAAEYILQAAEERTKELLKQLVEREQ